METDQKGISLYKLCLDPLFEQISVTSFYRSIYHFVVHCPLFRKRLYSTYYIHIFCSLFSHFPIRFLPSGRTLFNCFCFCSRTKSLVIVFIWGVFVRIYCRLIWRINSRFLDAPNAMKSWHKNVTYNPISVASWAEIWSRNKVLCVGFL